MSTQGTTFSKDPYRDKIEDLIAINLDAAEDLIRLAAVVRSQNERLRAIAAGQRPLTTRGANSPTAVNGRAA